MHSLTATFKITRASFNRCPFLKNASLASLERYAAQNGVLPQQVCPFLLSRKASTMAAIRGKDVKLVDMLDENAAGETEIGEIFEETSVPEVDYDTFFSDEVEKIKQEGRYRIFADLERKAGSFPVASYHEEGEVKKVIGWCSNDYLSMGQHPKVMQAMHEAIDQCGTGAGGTRNISGTNHNHVLLEKELADLHEKEASLVFSSCYVANETVLSTMSKLLPDCAVFSDQFNHASMIHGILNGKWGSGKYIYKHNDLEDLERLLKQFDDNGGKGKPKLIAFESVNSMEGSIADLNAIGDLAKKYNAYTFVDEVHAVGMYGRTGAGIAQRDNAVAKMDIITGTLGKSYGAMGGYIAGKSAFVDAMRSSCPGFIFTTAIPPAIAAAARTAVSVLKEDCDVRKRMHSNANKVHKRLRQGGFPLFPTVSHVTPVLVGDAVKCKAVSKRLMDKYNIYVQPINFPTVPRGTERLRITPNPVHTDEMIDDLIKALDEIWTEFDLPRMNHASPEKSEPVIEQLQVGGQGVYDYFEGDTMERFMAQVSNVERVPVAAAA